jgi:hypothetical protein
LHPFRVVTSGRVLLDRGAHVLASVVLCACLGMVVARVA